VKSGTMPEKEGNEGFCHRRGRTMPKKEGGEGFCHRRAGTMPKKEGGEGFLGLDYKVDTVWRDL